MQTMLLRSIPLALALWFAGAAHAQIKIGVAGPVTGANAAFGAQLTQGVQQAAEDINKAGGILGQKVEVEPGDDVSDPKQGVSVANKFVGDGVKFVVGHFNSGVTIPASEVYSENGVLFITPSATNPKVTDRGLWDAFRTCGRDDQQGMLWAELARDKLKGKKIAVVHDKTTYGKGLADAALDNMHKFGVKEVLYEGVNTGEKDYSAIVSKIKASGADYLMWGGLHTEGGLIVRQMRDQGMNTIMISGDGITDTEFAAIGGPGVEGTLMSFGPEPRNNPIGLALLHEAQPVTQHFAGVLVAAGLDEALDELFLALRQHNISGRRRRPQDAGRWHNMPSPGDRLNPNRGRAAAPSCDAPIRGARGLVLAHKAGAAHDIGDQNRRKLSGFAHLRHSAGKRTSTKTGLCRRIERRWPPHIAPGGGRRFYRG